MIYDTERILRKTNRISLSMHNYIKRKTLQCARITEKRVLSRFRGEIA